MEKCEYSLKGMCFNPDNLPKGIIAIPCRECNCCQESNEPRTTINNSDARISIVQDLHHYTHESIQADLLHINQEQPELAHE